MITNRSELKDFDVVEHASGDFYIYHAGILLGMAISGSWNSIEEISNKDFSLSPYTDNDWQIVRIYRRSSGQTWFFSKDRKWEVIWKKSELPEGEFELPNDDGFWVLKAGDSSVCYEIRTNPPVFRESGNPCPKGRWKKVELPTFEE